jgi:hypothetical protein
MYKFTSESLIFSFEDLKYRLPQINKEIKCVNIRPLSKTWFRKVSFLIRNDKISYEKFVIIHNKKFGLKILKALVVQHAFFLILKPFFDEYLFFTPSFFPEYSHSFSKY